MEEAIGSLSFHAGNFRCTLTWSEAGVSRFSFRRTRSGRRVETPGAARSQPSFVRRARREIETYFAGGKPDFSAVPLDLGRCGAFARSVYLAVSRIPYGQTLTYADVAERSGNRKAARAVGLCMKRNPVPILVPCHRVVRSDGGVGGFSSPDGAVMKTVLLRMEGARL